MKLCKTDPVACGDMATLGRSFAVETIPFSECEGFVCKMYGKRKLLEVNECQYISFYAKQGWSQSLPPCQVALRNHTMGANYQAAIWRQALDANPQIPSPESHG